MEAGSEGVAGGGYEASWPLVARAEDELRRHFELGDSRLTHSWAVGACARALSPAVRRGQRELLVAAALLHDIGKAAGLLEVGFHPVDGALYLRRQGWPAALCDLVAHHSGARFVAAAHDAELAQRLGALLRGPEGFVFERTRVSDALTTADQTVGPDGSLMPVEERMRDMLHRHGSGSPQARAQARRGPYIRKAVARTEARLAARPVFPTSEHASLFARLATRSPAPPSIGD